MSRDIASAVIVNEEKAKSYEGVSYALKYAALGIKKIPFLSTMSPGVKLLATATSAFSNYYKGERADVAVTMTMIDLGLTTVFLPYRVARLATPLLKATGDDKAAHFLKSTLGGFTKTVATVLLNPDNVALCDFMDHKVEMLANRWKAQSIGDGFVEHVRSLAEKHNWSQAIEDRYSILFSYRVAQHLVYEENGGFKIIPPQTQPCEINEAIFADVIKRVYDNAMETFESQLPSLYAEHFTSSVMRNSLQGDVILTEEQLTRLTQATTEKIRETVGNHLVGHGVPRAAQVISIERNSLQVGLRDVASMMQDGALLASIFQKPAIAKSLSSVGGGIERAVSGIEKVNTATAFLSKLAGVVSLFTGISSIVSAVAGLFSDDNADKLNEQLNRLSEQVSHLGKQLDCVLKNQMVMIDMFGVMQRRIFEMDQRLIQFIRTTNANFEFLKIKELNEAYDSIDFHLKKTNAIQLTDGELRQKLMILVTWLRSPYSSSPMMNGALYANVSSAEALEILAQAADNAASMHMIGFVLTRLQHHRIATPPEFSQLPPFQLYFQITKVFTLGMEALKPVSDDGCRSFADELENQFTLFSNMLNFLEKNDEIWKQLQQRYLVHLTEVKSAMYTVIQHSDDDRKKSLKTWLAIVPTELLSQKIYLLDRLDAMEEVRLLLVILSKWTHRFNSLVSTLPSKQDTLAMRVSNFYVNPFDYEFYYCSIGSNSDTSSANWNLTSSIQYRHNTATSTIIIQSGPFAFGKSFQNPFRTLTEYPMEWFFQSRQYEPMILHFAADTREYYFFRSCVFQFKNLASPYDRQVMKLARDVRYEFLDSYQNGAAATNFMVLFALFAVDKLSALRNAYQYYTAYNDGESAATEKRRAIVDPTILLWLTAILGRYDIFLSVQKPDSFDFSASVGTKKIGGYQLKNAGPGNVAHFHTTVEDGQYTLGDGKYLKSRYSYTSPIIPLMIAAKFNRVDVVEGLLREFTEHNKDIGLLKKDIDGRTPAQIALYHGHYALSKLLDRYSNTLSQSEREIVVREVEKNTTLEGTTKGAIADVLKLGGMFAQRLRENYQHSALENAAASARL